MLQVLPALEVGGVERGTLEVAAALVKRGHKSMVISSGGRMVRELEEQGSKHIHLPIAIKSPFTFRLVPRLRRIMIENGVDILHARSRMPAWVCYLAWKTMNRQTRPRFITTVHGPYTVNFYSRVMLRGERVIAISDFIHDYICKNYPDIDRNKIRIIHRGVDPARYFHGFTPSVEWMNSWDLEHAALKDKFLITLPARITRWKGHDDFIEIIAGLRAKNIPAHGLLAGDAHPRRKPYLQELKIRIGKKRLDQHITFLGHRNDMREIMSVSDVVLSLAKVPEAFGRTALEALALGIPVVAYDHGGASEVLARMFPKGKVKPFDTQGVVKTITDLYTQPEKPGTETPFTLDRMLGQVITLYEEILRAPRA